MTKLIETLKITHDWAIDRIYNLCDENEEYEYKNAFAIQQEFEEWLDPNILEHDVFSLEYLKEHS